ncbi:MAG: Class SAM-dependent methyltransferase [Thermoproteota archaeon]|nr:Class SAM-dependent methyltransferase [Thermoproteota archaeon]
MGIDFSEKTIDSAKQVSLNEKLSIMYHISDACDRIDLQNSQFYRVTYFMDIRYIEDYSGAMSEVSRVLKRERKIHFFHTSSMFLNSILKRRRNASRKSGEDTPNILD